MIFIKQFEVFSLDNHQDEAHKSVTIKPDDRCYFEFFNIEEVNKFRDELRQTFEFVFPFGCECEAIAAGQNIE